MPPIKKDKIFAAVQAVHSALLNLQPEERAKVLTSISAILEVAGGQLAVPPKLNPLAPTAPAPPQVTTPSQPSRPLSLVELIQDKTPKTIAQTIALFAYYREKCESTTRFGRDDLKAYFATAKLKPPSNYDRDFVEAVKKGWIHEDGNDSYLTSRGVETVESGFAGERASSRPPKPNSATRKKNRKASKDS